MSEQVKEMSCIEIVELVTEYLEGSLPALEVRRFEGHLELCEGCVTYLDQMRTSIALSGRLTEESLDPHTRAALIDTFRNWKSGLHL
jgi:predicted anti-sigma-YlaC factor YlaD